MTYKIYITSLGVGIGQNAPLKFFVSSRLSFAKNLTDLKIRPSTLQHNAPSKCTQMSAIDTESGLCMEDSSTN